MQSYNWNISVGCATEFTFQLKDLPTLQHMTCQLLPVEKYTLHDDKTEQGQTKGLFG